MKDKRLEKERLNEDSFERKVVKLKRLNINVEKGEERLNGKSG